MRLGIFGWFLLVGCTTTAAAPVVATVPISPETPTSASTPPPAPPVSPATCTDSTECAAGALCCPTVKGNAGSAQGPMTPFGPAHKTVNVCATDPRTECEGHELCGTQACRSPWPPMRMPGTPARTYVIECHMAGDCPKDATCALFYFQNYAASSLCVYNVAGEPHAAHVAPTCATDADCKAALPRWKSVLGDEGYAKALAGVRCTDLTKDFDKRRACAVPGNAPLP